MHVTHQFFIRQVSRILCIETATKVCSVAIGNHGECISSLTETEGLRHSAMLTKMIEQVLAKAAVKISDLDAIALSDGPGSYTGLRVGASVAKGLCFGRSIPLLTISTLKALAFQYRNSVHYILPTIDARRMEAYFAIYYQGSLVQAPEAIIWDKESVEELSASYPSLMICGDGIDKASSLFKGYSNVKVQATTCDAQNLILPSYEKFLSEDFSDVAYHKPFYYKSPNITVSKKKLLE